jgi:hypothetical protein
MRSSLFIKKHQYKAIFGVCENPSLGGRIGNTRVAYFAWKQDFPAQSRFPENSKASQFSYSPTISSFLLSPSKCIYQRVVCQNLFGKFIKINCFCLPKLT